MDVYKVINEVHKEIVNIGISKNQKNTQSNFMFRGIDAVYNTLGPIMAKHGLVIMPNVLNTEQVERKTKSGGNLFFSTVEMEFTFISSSDGSKHSTNFVGEAMDTSDKSINKAVTAAYKYMLFQTFSIPTEASTDSDSETHDVAARKPELLPHTVAWNRAKQHLFNGNELSVITKHFDISDANIALLKKEVQELENELEDMEVAQDDE